MDAPWYYQSTTVNVFADDRANAQYVINVGPLLLSAKYIEVLFENIRESRMSSGRLRRKVL